MTSSALSRPIDVGKLAIVTPSMIGSAQRAAFARASLAELHDRLGEKFVHVVADDVPMCRGKLFGVVPARLTCRIPNLTFWATAKRIYKEGRNVDFRRDAGGNSLKALSKALIRAKELNCTYAFIHLDDNAYAGTLDELIGASINALDRMPGLNLLRLSAYPILTGACDREKGNMSLCERAGDTIRFDSVSLRPVRGCGYTVWMSPWEPSTADGRFWPIMLWNAVYRIEFLEQLLSLKPVASLSGLGPVEAWYKNNWETAWPQLGGSFGFINMQFAGLERERNLNWKDLLALPNGAVF
jgi:hypothetical protein